MVTSTLQKNVPWLRWLVAGLSPPSRRFEPSSFLLRFVVDNVSLGEIFLRTPQFSPANIIPTMLHIRPYPQHKWENMGTFQKYMFFRKIAEHCIEKYFQFCLSFKADSHI